MLGYASLSWRTFAENRRECVVAFTKINSFRFVYRRLGEVKRTEVRADVKCVASFAYLKGKFYTMDSFGDVLACDVAGDPTMKFNTVPELRMSSFCFMAVWDEDLVLVNNYYDNGNRRESFEIFKLESMGDLRWEKLHGLMIEG